MPCRPCPRGFVLWLVLSLEVTSSRLCLSCGRRRQRPGQHLKCPLLPVSLPACWGPRRDPRHLIPATRPGLGGRAGGHSSAFPVASGGRAVWRRPAAEGRCRGTPPTRGTSVVTTVGTDGGRWRGLSRWGCLGAGPRRSPLPCPALPGSWARGLPVRLGAGTLGERGVRRYGPPLSSDQLQPAVCGLELCFCFCQSAALPAARVHWLGFLPVWWPGACSRPLVPLWAEALRPPCGVRPSRHSAARAPAWVPHPHAPLLGL